MDAFHIDCAKINEPGTAARLRNSADNASTCSLVGTCV